jgi:competence protein ComEA
MSFPRSLSRRDWLAMALCVPGGAAVVAATWLAAATVLAGQADTAPSQPGIVVAGSSLSASSSPSGPAADLVIDVQGAVRNPGVVLLPPGSRVADALQAAGGYSRDADLNAAATALNLASPLTDGAQVYVPVIGIAAQPGAGTGGGGGGSGTGLINLNTATPEELEALPGVGPVTVQKIVAARAEHPFMTLDELVERGVLDRGQIEDVRDLVTL